MQGIFKLSHPVLAHILFFTVAISAQPNDNQNSYNGTSVGSGFLEVDSQPQGAMVKISGKYVIVGKTPLLVPYRLYGRYEVKVEKKGYESKSATLDLLGDRRQKTFLQLARKTRAKAALRSTIFPGWGQFYGQNPGKGIIVLLGQTALGISTLLAVNGFQDKKDTYEFALKDYDEITNFEDKKTAYDLLVRAKQEADDARNFRDRMIYAAAGFWFYNILDSILFFSAKASPISISTSPDQITAGALQKQIMVKMKIDF